MPDIKERIKELRKANGYTQESLAKTLGLNAKSSIANYENGSNSPSDDIKKKMCELFDCSMDYLMGISNFKSLSDEKKHIVKCNIDAYREQLLSIGIKQSDIDNLIKVNYFMVDGKNLKEKIKNNIELLKKIKKTYPSNVFNNFSDLYSKILTQQNSDLIRKNYNKILENIPNEELFNYTQYYMCPVYGRISAGQPNWAEECIEGRLPIDPVLFDIVNPEEHFFLRVNGESMNKVVRNGAYALIRKQNYAEDGDIVVAIVNGDNEATLKKFKRFNEQFVSFEPMSSDESIKPINVDLKDTNVIILGKYVGKFEINK